MESAKRWFGKFRPKEKHKTSNKKTEPAPYGKEGSKTPSNDETPSNATKQKVAAAKQYIEKHYKEQMKSLEERRERYVCSPLSLLPVFIWCILYLFVCFFHVTLWNWLSIVSKCNSVSTVKLRLSGAFPVYLWEIVALHLQLEVSHSWCVV